MAVTGEGLKGLKRQSSWRNRSAIILRTYEQLLALLLCSLRGIDFADSKVLQ
jgi:hypothetical protein